MNCVILGGSGFIGSHVAELLQQKGMDVSVFVRPGTDIRRVPNPEKFAWLVGDICNREDVRRALRNQDCVIHLISTTAPKTSNENPFRDIETNLIGTVNVLEGMREEAVGRIVFASSGGTIYGNPFATPIPETHPTAPICSYGICKLAIEKYIHLYHELHRISYVILRMSNVYGERQRPDAGLGLISVVLSRILSREPIEIWGDGETIRDFVYVGDVADAIARAVEQVGCVRTVVNIGSGAGLSVNDIIRKIEILTGLDATVRYTEERDFDARTNVLDIRKAFRELGWKPQTPIDKGIRNMCDWHSRAEEETPAKQLQSLIR